MNGDPARGSASCSLQNCMAKHTPKSNVLLRQYSDTLIMAENSVQCSSSVLKQEGNLLN
jgi:hypothetical protein